MPIIGTQQSPLKIVTASTYPVAFGDTFLQFHYTRALPGAIDPARHNFVFHPPADENQAGDWSITVGEAKWLIRQIHMHAPAEHLVDVDPAQAKPFEVHLVHSRPGDVAAAGPKLVIGVFIRPGKETRKKPSLEKFADRVSRGVRRDEPAELNPADFLPDSHLNRFFHYEGSLTGPPYSEDVSWFVMASDGIVEQPTFDGLHKHAEHEAREVQALNRRFVLRSV